MIPALDDKAVGLLRRLLGETLDSQAFPAVVRFRLDHEADRGLIDSLIAENYIDASFGPRYRLTVQGLAACGTPESGAILETCALLVEPLKQLYRDDPGVQQAVAALATEWGRDPFVLRLSLTFLTRLSITVSTVYDPNGFVGAFTLAESVLDVRPLESNPMWQSFVRGRLETGESASSLPVHSDQALDRPTVFVSYSHESTEHKSDVLDLANKLRLDGIDVTLDRYLTNPPPEGWPKWCATRILRSQFVLMICTRIYSERVSGSPEGTVGKGAKWEGTVILNELYETGGRNERFIPVMLRAEDRDHIPTFVAGTSHYDLSSGSGYEELYRRLTDQPAVVPPPLGPLRRLPPVSEGSPGVPLGVQHAPNNDRRSEGAYANPFMILDDRGRWMLSEIADVEASDTILATLRDVDASVSAFIEDLRLDTKRPLAIAFGLGAAAVQLATAREVLGPNVHEWILSFNRRSHDSLGSVMEMSTQGYSADEIAQLRAERILLDALPSLRSRPAGGQLDELTLETLIRGVNSPLAIDRSPFPNMFSELGLGNPGFVPACKLLALIYLRVTNTVEHVTELSLSLSGVETLHVSFRGIRPRRYVNVAPAEIRVVGDCRLTGPGQTLA